MTEKYKAIIVILEGVQDNVDIFRHDDKENIEKHLAKAQHDIKVIDEDYGNSYLIELDLDLDLEGKMIDNICYGVISFANYSDEVSDAKFFADKESAVKYEKDFIMTDKIVYSMIYPVKVGVSSLLNPDYDSSGILTVELNIKPGK